MTYRKVETRIWNDEKFSQLSHDSQLCFLFILTHPAMTSLGAMRATIAGLAAELKYAERQFRAAIKAAMGMIVIDETNCFVWLPNFLRYNPPENPNVVKHYRNAAEALPECELKVELITRTRESLKDFAESFQKAFAEAFPEPFHKPFAEPFRNGMPNPEPEQKQEQEQEKNKEAQAPFVLPDWIPLETWNELLKVRKKKRAVNTPYALNLVVSELTKFRNAGENVTDILNKSIVSGWADVYSLNDRQNGNRKSTDSRVVAEEGKYAGLK